MSGSAHRLVSELQSRFEELEVRFHEAYWRSQIEATPEHEQRRAELELELRTVKGDAAALTSVEAALQEPLHDEKLRRQLEVLRLSLTGNQMGEAERAEMVELASEVESAFASHRPQIEGVRLSENDIDRHLRESNDPEHRKDVWEASKEIGASVAGRLRELARLRNHAARNLGFADYYRMELELQELPEEWLFGLLDELETLTDEPFDRWKGSLDAGLRERFGAETLYPWHYADPFFQVLPLDGRVSLDGALAAVDPAAVAGQTFRGWGIDLDGVLASSDLYARENKCQHAFCLDVDRRGDVRILANIVPGERWTDTMLHESGHAAYDISIDPHLPYLLRRPTHIFVTEAIALLSGRLVRDGEWLRRVVGLPAEEVSLVEPDLLRATAAQSLLFARWGLVMVHFERDLYSDPEMDLDTRWWELVERFQHLTPPPDPPSGAWASKIHFAVAPVYYHNYLLGDMLASQLTTTIEEECGGLVGVAAAGELLAERIFKKGSLVRWDELVQDATGRPLQAEDFAAGLA